MLNEGTRLEHLFLEKKIVRCVVEGEFELVILCFGVLGIQRKTKGISKC